VNATIETLAVLPKLAALKPKLMARNAVKNLDMSSGDPDTVRYDLGLHDDAVLTPWLFRKWSLDKVEDAYYALRAQFSGKGVLTVWRVITAPADWTPGGRHPGIYWSTKSHKSEAYWGEFKPGDLHWRMQATVTPQMVDWEGTIVANCAPVHGDDEGEIRLLGDVPVGVEHFEQLTFRAAT